MYYIEHVIAYHVVDVQQFWPRLCKTCVFAEPTGDNPLLCLFSAVVVVVLVLVLVLVLVVVLVLVLVPVVRGAEINDVEIAHSLRLPRPCLREWEPGFAMDSQLKTTENHLIWKGKIIGTIHLHFWVQNECSFYRVYTLGSCGCSLGPVTVITRMTLHFLTQRSQPKRTHECPFRRILGPAARFAALQTYLDINLDGGPIYLGNL